MIFRQNKKRRTRYSYILCANFWPPSLMQKWHPFRVEHILYKQSGFAWRMSNSSWLFVFKCSLSSNGIANTVCLNTIHREKWTVLGLVTVQATRFFLCSLSTCQTRHADLHELLVRSCLELSRTRSSYFKVYILNR